MHVPSKIDRRNTQKQILKNKKQEQVRNAKFFGGARGAAKIVVCCFRLKGLSVDGCVALS